jgi:hypothetical protein
MMIISKLIPNKNYEKSTIKYHLLPYKGEPIFEARIKDKKLSYDRKTDAVAFTVRYKGRIKKGFIAAEITPCQGSFDLDTPNLNREHNSVSSFCEKTVKDNGESNTIYNIAKDIGKLDSRNIEIDELEWEWKIPENTPLCGYKTTIGVWDVSSYEKKNNKPSLKQFCDDSFNVIDSDSSHYRQYIST